MLWTQHVDKDIKYYVGEKPSAESQVAQFGENFKTCRNLLTHHSPRTQEEDGWWWIVKKVMDVKRDKDPTNIPMHNNKKPCAKDLQDVMGIYDAKEMDNLVVVQHESGAVTWMH